jgi:hypothetical protein
MFWKIPTLFGETYLTVWGDVSHCLRRRASLFGETYLTVWGDDFEVKYLKLNRYQTAYLFTLLLLIYNNNRGALSARAVVALPKRVL